MSGVTAQQLWRQYKHLSQNSDLLASHVRVSLLNDNVRHWHVLLRGPDGTPHENGLFRVSITFPQHASPVVQFLTPVFHPNVDVDGHTSLSLLGNFSQEESISSLLTSLVVFLNSPSPSDPLNSDAARLYMQSRTAYDDFVRRYTWLYAHASEMDAWQVHTASTSGGNSMEDEDMSSFSSKKRSMSFQQQPNTLMTYENNENDLSMDLNCNTLFGLATVSSPSVDSNPFAVHKPNVNQFTERKLSGSKRKFSMVTSDEAKEDQVFAEAVNRTEIVKRMRVNARRMFSLDSKSLNAHVNQWNGSNSQQQQQGNNAPRKTFLPALNTERNVNVPPPQQGQLTPLIFDYSNKMFL